ncbi:unnamed protein product [Adineta steineri]|uniref:PPM-type phosphatase domain-containing protein n=1 Tax=Adineta steineri TaxID=433720 RepID=A0A818MLF7_9BILA|nr:unnamed protein product [Adineta steineri]CAF3591244.1 unnamed protein product [Adineta steineri]
MSDSEIESKSQKEEEEDEQGGEEELPRESSATSSEQEHTSDIVESINDQSKPDITVVCTICERYVNICDLTTHMVYHNALRLFKLKEAPATIEILLKQREVIIQRMQRLKISEESYLKYVKTINDTFQILKRTIDPYDYLDDTHIYDNNEASNVQGLSFIPHNRIFLSIGMCTSQNKQYKVDMEDTMKFIDCFGGNEKFAYFGLFDGYNGKAASSLCRDYLHEAILLEMSKLLKDMNSSEVEDALINRLYTRMIDPLRNNSDIKDIGDVYPLAYLKMDHFLSRGMHETSSVRWSGTSALTAVVVLNDTIDESFVDLEEYNDRNTSISLGQIHIANCGNVEALAIQPDKAFLMTQKHTLNNKYERQRVLDAGIKISQNELIDGVFETTRGLGNHGDKELKKCVINSPYCLTYDIDSSIECIILATEGLWQALDYDIVVDIVTQCLPSHEIPESKRNHTAVQSVLEKYDPSIIIPYLPNEDEVIACMDEILDLFEEENDNDEINKIYFSSIRNHGVQCSETEIQQDVFDSLPDKYRLRLELSQIITERLVSAALLAQSKSNISVLCLLLPGAAV